MQVDTWRINYKCVCVCGGGVTEARQKGHSVQGTNRIQGAECRVQTGYNGSVQGKTPETKNYEEEWPVGQRKQREQNKRRREEERGRKTGQVTPTTEIEIETENGGRVASRNGTEPISTTTEQRKVVVVGVGCGPTGPGYNQYREAAIGTRLSGSTSPHEQLRTRVYDGGSGGGRLMSQNSEQIKSGRGGRRTPGMRTRTRTRYAYRIQYMRMGEDVVSAPTAAAAHANDVNNDVPNCADREVCVYGGG